MSSVSEPNQQGDGLEAAVDQAIAACGGDTRAAVRALIVANNFLESEMGELKKAVSHAYTRGRFRTYTGRSCRGAASQTVSIPKATEMNALHSRAVVWPIRTDEFVEPREKRAAIAIANPCPMEAAGNVRADARDKPTIIPGTVSFDGVSVRPISTPS